MEQNIETKDVQRTEYLDKNGLDMLWAKVKENTHNQVEVERNRAVAKENSIIDKIDNLKYVPYTKLENGRYNIPDGISTRYITSEGEDNDSFNVFPNSKLSFGTLYGGVSIHSESDRHGSTKEISVDYDDMRIKFTDGTPSNTYAIYGEHGVMLNVDNSSQSLLTADQSVKVIGTDITPLENGKVPAEYLDLSQYIKISDAYQGCIPYYNKYTEREIQRYQLADKEGIELSSYGTRTELLGTDISISSGSEDLKLTRSGISINSYGGESNHFYLDVNSQPELNLYDDKCNISAKIFRDGYARIGIRNHNYGQSTYDLKLSADGIEMLSKTTKDIVTANNSTAHIGLDDDQTEYTYVAPLENGKVPAEYLDLSQYVLKSVYDEKIASLESRIAALEANHTTE